MIRLGNVAAGSLRAAMLVAALPAGSLAVPDPAVAQNLGDIRPPEGPLVLQSRGSFHVGGEQFEQRVDATNDDVRLMTTADTGVRGNGHMIMMDRNSLQVADLILAWIGETTQ